MCDIPCLLAHPQYVAYLLTPLTTSTKFFAMIWSVRSEGCSGSNQRNESSFGSLWQLLPVLSQWLIYPVTLAGGARYSSGW